MLLLSLLLLALLLLEQLLLAPLLAAGSIWKGWAAKVKQTENTIGVTPRQ